MSKSWSEGMKCICGDGPPREDCGQYEYHVNARSVTGPFRCDRHETYLPCRACAWETSQ